MSYQKQRFQRAVRSLALLLAQHRKALEATLEELETKHKIRS